MKTKLEKENNTIDKNLDFVMCVCGCSSSKLSFKAVKVFGRARLLNRLCHFIQ